MGEKPPAYLKRWTDISYIGMVQEPAGQSQAVRSEDERSVNEVEREYAFRVTRYKSGG